ncbi:hypothetical protein GEMRC1_012361 [Eukaryota sp. GEM-RC1]
MQTRNRKRTATQSKLSLTSAGLNIKQSKIDTHSWKVEGSLAMRFPDNWLPTSKIASFDLDGTLINTKSGAKFAKSADDFLLFHPSIPTKLNQLHSDGFSLVIFSNQLGVSSKKLTLQSLQSRIDSLLSILDLPFAVYCALDSDKFRKPCPAMLRSLSQQFNVDIDKENSFYVGDAAGRFDPDTKKKTDFSASDRAFAQNCGLKFYTPEEFFLNEPVSTSFSFGYDPSNHFERNLSNDYDLGSLIESRDQKIIVITGPPASGKSSLVARSFLSNGFVSVSRDQLKTPAKVMSTLETHVESKKTVVVDNTSPSVSSREPFIEVAKQHGIPIVSVVIKASKQVCAHLNSIRKCKGGRSVPPVAVHTFFKKFEEPSKNEGFDDVIILDFKPVLDSEKEADDFFMIYS